MSVIAHWTTQKVRLGSLAATQAVVSHEGGVIAWCEGLEDAEQVVAALNNSRGAVDRAEQAEKLLRLVRPMIPHADYPSGLRGDACAAIDRFLGGQ